MTISIISRESAVYAKITVISYLDRRKNILDEI
jgi:hypothetical protein